MKQPSEILNFMDSLPHEVKQFPKTRFSLTSKLFIEKLFRNMFAADKQWNRTDTMVDYLDIDFTKDSSWRGKDYFHLNSHVKDKIENLDKEGIEYSFTITHGKHKRDVSVIMVGSPIILKENPELFKEAIQKIYIWLHVAFQYTSLQCSQKLCIYLYFTDLLKVLPKKRGEPIDTIHANTAFTTSCKLETEIYLFRYEEWFKVLIHETFHCLGLDFSHIDNARTRDAILRLFPVDSDVNLSETYCEVWAEVFNTLFFVFFQNKNKDIENLIRKTEDYLDTERLFSLFQSCKVLHFYGISYQDLFHKEGDSLEKKHARKSRFRERTNVLSYYILKCLIMFYIDDFLVWCHHYNTPAFSIQFNTSYLVEYCGFIEERHRRDEFLQAKDRMERWFAGAGSGSGAIMQSMRMTVFG